MSNVLLRVGTRKAAFIYTSDEKRERWTISEPLFPGWNVFHMAADLRADPPRLYAAVNHPVWGPSVAKSTDLGKTWEQRSQGLGFPQDMQLAVTNVWFVQPGHETEPGVVYAGTAPAGLFRSEDWGHSWAPIDAINRHDYRPFWQPIPGGPPSADAQRMTMSLHSIQIDPRDAKQMYVAVSGGGSYVTSDGGGSWRLFSQHALATSDEARSFVTQGLSDAPTDIDPAAAHDMHRLRLDTKNPDRLWAQAHAGVFRSDDRGGTWTDVTPGLPSFHGFPIAVTKRAPDAAYVVPLEPGADNFRVCPGQLAVHRTRDGGDSWQVLTDGLPGPNNYQSVYREALDTDGLDPEGVYVGTSNGLVYASADGGDHWQTLPGMLPPVLSVAPLTF